MTKSQVAAALALAYVAGTVVAPVSKIYAEAVITPDCAPSVTLEEARTISGMDIDTIVARIKEMPLYQTYKTVMDFKVAYPVITVAGVKTTAIDQAVLDMAQAATDADAVVSAAQGVVDSVDADALKTSIRQILGVKPEAIEATETVDLIAYARENLPAYEEYKALLTAINSGSTVKMKAAAEAINAIVADTFDIDTVFADMSDKTTIKTTLLNSTTKKYRNVRDVEAKVITLETAQADAETALGDKEAAVQAQADALETIRAAFDTLKAKGVTINDRAYNQPTVFNTLKFIKGDASGISGYNEWLALVNLTESTNGFSNTALNNPVYYDIMHALDNAGINSDEFLNPMAERKICSPDGNFAVRGLLPASKVAVVAEEIDGTLAGYEDKEQAIYDIHVAYKGRNITDWDDNRHYEVTVNVPESMNGETVNVYYVGEDQVTIQPTTYDAENNTVTFVTNHFSIYALVGDKKVEETPSDPQDPSFGGIDNSDPSFNVTPEKPVVSVNPDPIVKPEAPTTKLPTVAAPNTGAIVAETATSKTNATAGIIASFIAVATAAMAAIARFVRRDA